MTSLRPDLVTALQHEPSFASAVGPFYELLVDAALPRVLARLQPLRFRHAAAQLLRRNAALRALVRRRAHALLCDAPAGGARLLRDAAHDRAAALSAVSVRERVWAAAAGAVAAALARLLAFLNTDGNLLVLESPVPQMVVGWLDLAADPAATPVDSAVGYGRDAGPGVAYPFAFLVYRRLEEAFVEAAQRRAPFAAYVAELGGVLQRLQESDCLQCAEGLELYARDALDFRHRVHDPDAAAILARVLVRTAAQPPTLLAVHEALMLADSRFRVLVAVAQYLPLSQYVPADAGTSVPDAREATRACLVGIVADCLSRVPAAHGPAAAFQGWAAYFTSRRMIVRLAFAEFAAECAEEDEDWDLRQWRAMEVLAVLVPPAVRGDLTCKFISDLHTAIEGETAAGVLRKVRPLCRASCALMQGVAGFQLGEGVWGGSIEPPKTGGGATPA